MRTKTFLLGMVVGGVTAGVTALLTAPASGKETRTNLQDNKNMMLKQMEDIRNSLSELKTNTIIASQEGKDVIGIFLKDMTEAFSTWKEEIKPHQEELSKELEKIEATIKELETKINEK